MLLYLLYHSNNLLNYLDVYMYIDEIVTVETNYQVVLVVNSFALIMQWNPFFKIEEIRIKKISTDLSENLDTK